MITQKSQFERWSFELFFSGLLLYRFLYVFRLVEKGILEFSVKLEQLLV